MGLWNGNSQGMIVIYKRRRVQNPLVGFDLVLCPVTLWTRIWEKSALLFCGAQGSILHEVPERERSSKCKYTSILFKKETSECVMYSSDSDKNKYYFVWPSIIQS